MGVSSDGMLYFGFQVGGEDEAPEWLENTEDRDFDTFLIERAGMSYGGTPYDERKKVIDSCPADLGLFCSYDYPMYVLMVRGAKHRVSRGHLKEIGAAELAVDQAKIDAFKEWCETNGIEWQEPKWLLCSMYG